MTRLLYLLSDHWLLALLIAGVVASVTLVGLGRRVRPSGPLALLLIAGLLLHLCPRRPQAVGVRRVGRDRRAGLFVLKVLNLVFTGLWSRHVASGPGDSSHSPRRVRRGDPGRRPEHRSQPGDPRIRPALVAPAPSRDSLAGAVQLPESRRTRADSAVGGAGDSVLARRPARVRPGRAPAPPAERKRLRPRTLDRSLSVPPETDPSSAEGIAISAGCGSRRS